MSGRWRWVALAGVLLAAVAGAGAYVAVSRFPSPVHHHAARAALVRTPPLSPLPSTAQVPEPVSFAAALATVARDSAFGGHLAGEVVDGETGEQLFAENPALPLPPASTVKLLTAVAALSALGPDGALSTDVVRSGDTLYLVGGGDVTLGSRPGIGYPPRADLTDLAARVAANLGTTRRVRLCIDTSAWTGPKVAPGWRPAYFTNGDIAPLSPLEVDEGRIRPTAPARVGDPAAQAAADFTAALKARSVTVAGPTCRGTAPSSGFGIAAIGSGRVAALVQHMLTVSDNDLAESLGRAVARQTGRAADFDDAAAAVVAEVQKLGVDTTGVSLHDTSGLSRLDRVPARTLVQVLQLAASPEHPALRAALEGLPVAAFTGTLADRYRRGPAAMGAGLARAKTGTLAGVNAIAGTVVDADGRLLVYAFLTDRAVGPDATEAALDRLVGRIAAYR